MSAVAPEYSTGEVLLGSAYRKFLLQLRDSEVDLELVASLPTQVPHNFGGVELWRELIFSRGGIESPLRGGQYGSALSRQLMPIVPTVARVACVLGKKPRSRWYPANLLLEVIGAGDGETNGSNLIVSLGKALEVDDTDDLFARFVDRALAAITPAPAVAPYHSIALTDGELHAYRGRTVTTGQFSPAERFCLDLPTILGLKAQLTRRQWTVLVEALFRLGLGMHTLWVCQLNVLMWDKICLCALGSKPAAMPTRRSGCRLGWECTHRLLKTVGKSCRSLRTDILTTPVGQQERDRSRSARLVAKAMH